jgi:hypothetical protein
MDCRIARAGDRVSTAATSPCARAVRRWRALSQNRIIVHHSMLLLGASRTSEWLFAGFRAMWRGKRKRSDHAAHRAQRYPTH